MKDDSNFLRLTVEDYICPECGEAFQEEPKLWQQEPTGEAEAEAKQFCREATLMYLSRHKAIP